MASERYWIQLLFSSSPSLFLSFHGPKHLVRGPRLVAMAMVLATEVNRAFKEEKDGEQRGRQKKNGGERVRGKVATGGVEMRGEGLHGGDPKLHI